MGQRSQIYLRIKNPMKNKEYVATLDDKGIVAAKLVFGNKKVSILPYHHQWLFGLTFVGMVHNILSEARKNYSNPFHPFSSNFNFNTYPKNFLGHTKKNVVSNTNVQHTLDLVNHFISFQGNKDIAEKTGRYGFERFTYIGLEHIDLATGKVSQKGTHAQNDCTVGDNNDGIAIIDLIEQKYCFVNIFDYDDDDADGIYSLYSMQPLEAKVYTKAYYPDIDDLEKVLFAKDLMQDFQVLTMVELSKILPNNFNVE